MSNNAEFIHNMYAAFSRGDIPAILAAVADDAEWISYGPAGIPYAGVFKGPAGAAQFFQALGGTQSEQKLTILETYSDGDQVMTVGRYSGVVNATQKRFDFEVAHFFTVRNGKVVRFLDFYDTAAQLEAYTSAARASA